VSTHLHPRAAAALVSAVVLGLIALELTDVRLRRWWAGRPLTAAVVAGLLVLLLTLLVVDQLIRKRQVRERSRAVAAQVAILMGQATRSADAVSAVLDGSGDREATGDELRTYLMMLLVAAPLLIDTAASRSFLEQAQRLAGVMARALGALSSSTEPVSRGRLDAAVEELRTSSRPLVSVLNLERFTAADPDVVG
jgi:hypothetical protein